MPALLALAPPTLPCPPGARTSTSQSITPLSRTQCLPRALGISRAVPASVDVLTALRLLSGSRWGGCKRTRCRRPQHEHGQSLGSSGVDLLVPVQVGTAAEALAAEWAGVGPHATVGALVSSEMRAVAEALATVEAVVGLLARVRAIMRDEIGALAKALAALRARVGLDASVRTLVRDQGGALGEALAADGALVRLGAGVSALVCD